MAYYVYLVACVDRTFYCGYTVDLKKRVADHNLSDKGAKYTRGRRPVKLVYSEACVTLSEALSRECQIKKLSHAEKLALTM